jgi:hypothetical protein
MRIMYHDTNENLILKNATKPGPNSIKMFFTVLLKLTEEHNGTMVSKLLKSEYPRHYIKQYA